MTANVIQYIMNFTDPLRQPFVVNPYSANGSDSPLSTVLDPSATNANTSLIFYGKGSPNYGQNIEENFLYLMEHFSGGTAPANPISGQLWYQRYDIIHTSGGWYIWSDTTRVWEPITVVSTPGAPVGSPSVGNQYQVDQTVSPNRLFYGIIATNNPLVGQWIARTYTQNLSLGNLTGSPTPLPQKQLNVYTGNTQTGNADKPYTGGWTAVSDVFAGSVAPTNPSLGSMWFNTGTSDLEIYNGTSFVPLITASTVIPISQGGTGQTTAPTAINALLPSQSGLGATYFLNTDGVNVHWTQISPSGTGTVTSVAVTSSFGIVVTGSPITTSGTINLTVNPELQGLADLGSPSPGSTGFVQRTGVASYVAANLTSSQITTALGYTPINKAGDTVNGTLTFTSGTVTGLAAPVNPSDAATKAYVDFNDPTGLTFAVGTNVLTLMIPAGNLTTTLNFGPTNSPPYVPIEDEILEDNPFPPATVDAAIHALDYGVQRRTIPKRYVVQGVSNGGGTLNGSHYIYNVPDYIVGTGRLMFFINGVKWVASSSGYQRIIFDNSNGPNGFGSLGLNRILSTTTTSLFSATTYDFFIQVDGGPTHHISFLGSAALTFGALVNEINALFAASPAIGATALLQDDNAITIYSNSRGPGSSVNLSHGIINDLFAFPPGNFLSFFMELGTVHTSPSSGRITDPNQANGADFGYYDEIGNYGSFSQTIQISSSNSIFAGISPRPIDTSTLEAIVIGGDGSPYYD